MAPDKEDLDYRAIYDEIVDRIPLRTPESYKKRRRDPYLDQIFKDKTIMLLERSNKKYYDKNHEWQWKGWFLGFCLKKETDIFIAFLSTQLTSAVQSISVLVHYQYT